ncbi:Ada metal-binding domain-containing protein [Peteryoungia aggregata]|uniref:Ada metal-binding domain-containing protein n=1 Tax=Peteryoungia aggregata TaxID=34013 RepID=UPI0027D81B95|nr:Ada metal-binding domain-containing protein [Peteryoungia aggregata]
MNPLLPDDPRWQAIRIRDRAADGSFVYAVRSTGIFCRPSCPSRPARRENVIIHETAEAALAGGFRSCLRCRPERAVGQCALTPGRSI